MKVFASVLLLGSAISFLLLTTVLNLPNTYFLPVSVPYSSLTKPVKKQADCLAQNIYFEAAHESDEGKVAVAMVTLNRVISGKYADNICNVVNQRTNNTCQFSWVCESVNKNKLLTITDTMLYNNIRELAVRVMMNYGVMDDVTKGATYYHADYVNPNWGLPKTTKIGRHIFYKKRGDLENKTRELIL
jgi:spore germination cell wall hydrolase CwlJ-like protein